MSSRKRAAVKEQKSQSSLDNFVSKQARHSEATCKGDRIDTCNDEKSSFHGKFTSNQSKMQSLSNAPRMSHQITSRQEKFHIYCDLDGVLVDFNAGVQKIFHGKGANEIAPNLLWSAIARADSFFQHLPWTKDGKELWQAIYQSSPDILTGVPHNMKSRDEKFLWCQRELFSIDHVNHVDMAGPKNSHTLMKGHWIHKDQQQSTSSSSEPISQSSSSTKLNQSSSQGQIVVNVITCWSRQKHMQSRPGAVLIDDRSDLAEAWERKGGIFIHHTNTARTLELLREKGILTFNHYDMDNQKIVSIL